ncbi:uncharacterized protein LOC122644790 [Telopea speciosissima]|uniref:uncharacterized protein LOC122644790 n=1 Tax=Telopea speciosissima TaxID=54955 RepID=UPI001CC5675A|nr:uncharacterized protein LOC122644790 [Telopea speciosissima]
MVKQRDDLWKYVEDSKGRFKCNFCNKEYAGGISRVKYHLSCHKGHDIGICCNVPDDVQVEALRALSKKAKTGESSTACNVSSSQNPIEIGRQTGQPSRVQQRSVDVMFKQKDKDGVDDDMAQHFILNNIAFNVIQTPFFQQMIRSVACYGPSYSIPSYSTLRTKLVQRAKKNVEEYVSTVKESWSLSGCTIMSDMWTDMKERAFINVIAYSPKGAVFLKSFECSDASKTGLFLRDTLEPIIEEIGPEKVVQLISDNASNYGVAISLIMEKYPHIHRIRCAAHGVQLLLKDIDSQIPWVKEVFEKSKLIISFMYKHGTVLALMRESTGNKELRKPCKTRFASNFLMLKSILEVEDFLRVMVASAEWRINRHCRSELGVMVTKIIQTTEFWLNGRDVYSILEPLIIVLRLVDGDGATNPFLYEAMERARNTIIHRCNNNPAKYERLLQLFDSRKEANILHPVQVAAAFLNPCLIYEGKISYNQNDVQRAMIYITKSMVPPNEKKQFGKEINVYLDKEEMLFHDLSLAMIDCHPRK